MDSNVDLVVKAVLDANHNPITTKEISEASGLTVQQVGGAINRVVNSGGYKIKRIKRGVFCFDPPEGLRMPKSKMEAVMEVLRDKGEIEHTEIAEIIGISQYQVHDLMAKTKQKHRVKFKRHVIYRLEK